ncbi:MAG: hypothetical protein GEV10_07865 [Streptosporangiales bacterium]|nr:hypothetical protein [Streptosporangiales bacterium]
MRDLEAIDPSSVRRLPAAHQHFLRPLGLILVMNGVNLLTSTLLDDAPSAGAVLDGLGLVAGAVSLLVAPLLIVAPRLTWARLEGTTLVTRHVFVTRRVDLAAARVRITNHLLVAKDDLSGRSVSQPLLSEGAPLASADLLALADAVHRVEGQASGASTAAETAGALRDLATNEPLRHSLSGRKNRLVSVMYVLAWIVCGLTVLAILIRLLDFSS